ncbi:SDR family oxidoreductase [Thauera sp.]|jgi:2-keto-3-deoxy-L-fuconate dehydrogenase|uniref:SDR family oxidoreductase n=1 Tax=Thauera sp. TaxID=1905334 RepID=UPI002A36E03D|nr:SDR family oxidoreductase [Thauera sp.]MDX9886935.1 SDR family oxidoreductase [Thauera sp.]
MENALAGKRVLITQATAFMGPMLSEVFAAQGADVIASADELVEVDAAERIVHAAGRIDVLVANLAIKAPSTAALDVTEAEWRDVFAALVDPLPRLVRAVAPAMVERRAGKILLMGSAAALRGMKRASTYSAARGAQLAYVQAIGVELAAHNVQVNAVAQNFVDNPTYFPADVQANPRFQERLAREVPLGRLVSAREDALFAAYLCSPAADCFVGQVFPVCGGWVGR